MPTDSVELQQIQAEAEDIAKSVAQRASTAHLLLAIFTVPGGADQLLRERGLSEDAVLGQLSALGRAPEALSDYKKILAEFPYLLNDEQRKLVESLLAVPA